MSAITEEPNTGRRLTPASGPSVNRRPVNTGLRAAASTPHTHTSPPCSQLLCPPARRRWRPRRPLPHLHGRGRRWPRLTAGAAAAATPQLSGPVSPRSLSALQASQPSARRRGAAAARAARPARSVVPPQKTLSLPAPPRGERAGSPLAPPRGEPSRSALASARARRGEPASAPPRGPPSPDTVLPVESFAGRRAAGAPRPTLGTGPEIALLLQARTGASLTGSSADAGETHWTAMSQMEARSEQCISSSIHELPCAWFHTELRASKN